MLPQSFSSSGHCDAARPAPRHGVECRPWLPDWHSCFQKEEVQSQGQCGDLQSENGPS